MYIIAASRGGALMLCESVEVTAYFYVAAGLLSAMTCFSLFSFPDRSSDSSPLFSQLTSLQIYLFISIVVAGRILYKSKRPK